MTGAVQAGGQKGHLKKCWCDLPLLDVSMGIASGLKNTTNPRVISRVIRRDYLVGVSIRPNTPRGKLPSTAAPNKLVSKRQ